MSLADDQRALWDVVIRGVDPADPLVPRLSGPPTVAADRARLAREMVMLRFLDALRAELPMTARLLGGALPRHLVRLLQKRPSRDPDLGRFPRGLAELLEGPARAVALLEVARAESFEAADAEPVTLEALRGVPPEAFATLVVRLVPSLRIVRTDHDAGALWKALDAGEENPATLGRPTCAVVWRRAWAVFHAEVAPAESAALKAASEGAPFAALLECFATEPEPLQAAWNAVGSWFGEGMVASVGV